MNINQSGVMTVSALNQAVAQLLERHFPLCWISGEISNFTRAASGHWYFSLKDASAQVRAVMFRGRSQYADFIPREGDKVEVRATVSLYPARGDFQINVEAIRRAGVGNLYEAFLRLKASLASEGLFDPSNKRPIPAFPRRIGVITSLQAAALKDVLSSLQRRAPHVEVIIYPCPVQGAGAAEKIAQAIASADARQECEVLILCRGGGSIEDLWPFNEEIVARTLFHCELPVISGVGHETDFSIADFVADLRAATPTAAAELATPSRFDSLQGLQRLQQSMQQKMRSQLDNQMQTLDYLARRLISPATLIANKKLQLHNQMQRLRYARLIPMQKSRSELNQLSLRIQSSAKNILQPRQQMIEHSKHQLQTSFQRKLLARREALQHLQVQLELLNPQRTLERGYAIVSTTDQRVVRSSADLKPHQQLYIRTAIDKSLVTIEKFEKL